MTITTQMSVIRRTITDLRHELNRTTDNPIVRNDLEARIEALEAAIRTLGIVDMLRAELTTLLAAMTEVG